MNPIMCAINESPGAAGALRVAARLCDRLGPPLVVVHVVEDVPVSPPARSEARAGGLRLVERILSEEGVHGADVRVRIGGPAAELAEIAAEVGPELVVIGSKPNGRQPRPPLRSRLATELGRVCPAPVVVVPPDTPSGRGERTPEIATAGRT